MSQNRFEKLLQTAKTAQPPAPDASDVQISESLNIQTPKAEDGRLDVQAPKAKSSREGNSPDFQASGLSDDQTSQAKSRSKAFKRTTLYLTQPLHRQLKRASLDHELEMSDIAEAAIQQWLADHPTGQG